MLLPRDLRPLVFWPSFLILVGGAGLSVVDLDRFLGVTRSLNDAILNHFGWLFSYGSFYLLVLTVLVYCSPWGGSLRPVVERRCPGASAHRGHTGEPGFGDPARGDYVRGIGHNGLRRGIARLSSLNALLLLLLGVFVSLAGPTRAQLTLTAEGLGAYVRHFIDLSLLTGSTDGDSWPLHWSVFYFAVWFAWAPVAALCLGRLGRGYSVREFIRMLSNLGGIAAITLVLAASLSLWRWMFAGSGLRPVPVPVPSGSPTDC